MKYIEIHEKKDQNRNRIGILTVSSFAALSLMSIQNISSDGSKHLPLGNYKNLDMAVFLKV